MRKLKFLLPELMQAIENKPEHIQLQIEASLENIVQQMLGEIKHIPDIQKPDVQKPEETEEPDIQKSDIQKSDIQKPDVQKHEETEDKF